MDKLLPKLLELEIAGEIAAPGWKISAFGEKWIVILSIRPSYKPANIFALSLRWFILALIWSGVFYR